MASPGIGISTSTLTINIFDGTRNPLEVNTNILYRIFDGNQNQVRVTELRNSLLRFSDLPFYDNFGDNYRVVVWASGYYSAGFVPIPLSPAAPVNLELMLLPKKNWFNFANADWDSIRLTYPFIAAGVSDTEGKARYADLMEK